MFNQLLYAIRLIAIQALNDMDMDIIRHIHVAIMHVINLNQNISFYFQIHGYQRITALRS